MHVIIVAAAALFTLLLGASSALAQLAPDPATYSGCGLIPGDVVTAMYYDEDCETAIVDETGSWFIEVNDHSPCRPSPGAAARIDFLVNGDQADESFVYAYGHREGGIVFSGLRLRPRIEVRVADGVVTPADKSDASTADYLLEQWPVIMLTLATLALIAIAAAEITMVLRARRE